MATGSSNMTTYKASQVIGNDSATSAASALLLNGASSERDTWIFSNSNGTNEGIKHIYSASVNKIKVVTSNTEKFGVDVTSGNTYIKGIVGIDYDPDSVSDYKLYVNGDSYIKGYVLAYSDFKTERTGYGLYLMDGASKRYAGIYDNGSNIWIGATSSTGQHHKGGLYLSAGHNGTTGNKSIYISIPADGGATTSHTTYPLVYRDSANNNGGSATNGIYVDSDGKTVKMTYSLNATVPVGAVNVFPYYSAANTLSTIATKDGALYSTGTNAAPTWGTLPTAQGGTGNTSYTATRLLYTNTATKFASTTITSDGGYLGKVSYLSVNTDHQTNYRVYINGGLYATQARVQNTSPSIQLASSDLDDLNAADSGLTGGRESGVEFYTKDFGTWVGEVGQGYNTDGSIWMRLYLRNHKTDGSNVNNYIQLYANKDGTTSYAVANKSGFRSAISAKAIQTAVSDPSASGSGITYIATISQNTEGVITATKSTVRDASTSQSGVVSTGTQSFAGAKTFTSNLQVNGNITANGGYLKSTLNSNTVTIGSANTGFCHFQNSADIPFYFNKTVYVNGDVYYYNTKVHMSSTGFHPPKNGGIYWDPYVESASDASDVSRIIQVASGCAGGTELQIYQANDATDCINLVTPKSIYLNSKEAFNVSDSWLRINENKKFTSGVYFGSSLVRVDGTFRAGTGSGSWTDITAGVVVSRIDSGEARLEARNGTHRVYLYCNSDGRAGLYGVRTDGTAHSLIAFANNSSTGTFYGNCTGSSGSCTGNAATATTASSCSGNAASATKLGTDAGNANTPVYFTGGKPSACNNKLGAVNANSFWGMRGADNGDSWIRTTSSGIIPVQSGNKGSGHCGLGTSSWYFSSAYIDTITSNKTYGAVWNDIAECRETEQVVPGSVVVETGGKMICSYERLQATARVVSDTYGYCMGEPTEDGTPIAIAGRVLVYPYQDRTNYQLGDCVCAAPNGTVDIMTREEIKNYPDRIVGTVSEVPNYEYYEPRGSGGEKAIINGRIWIYVK